MLLFKKIILLFLFFSLLVSCSNNKNINDFIGLEVSESLSDIYVNKKNERRHQITRLELEKIFNSPKSYNDSKNFKYSLDFEINESISGTILSTSLSTMTFNVSFSLNDRSDNSTIFTDQFKVISSFGSVTSLYGKEQAQKNTTTKLSLSSASEINFRLRYFFSKLKIVNETE